MSEDYLRLESLVQKVVSPYLGTHGLYSGDGSVAHCSCVLGKTHTFMSVCLCIPLLPCVLENK